MKKLILFSVAILLSIGVMAQGVNFGVKAGLNLPTITGDDTDNLSSFATYHAGVVAEIEVSDQFSVQPECMFSCQGAEYTDSEDDEILYDGKFLFAYINVPVMAKFEVTEGLNLEAGPQLGFLIEATDEFESDSFSGEEDIKEDIKGTDVSLNFGASYDFPNGIFVGARYNLGLTDINDFEGTDAKNQNAVFQFSVGYLFGKKANKED